MLQVEFYIASLKVSANCCTPSELTVQQVLMHGQPFVLEWWSSLGINLTLLATREWSVLHSALWYLQVWRTLLRSAFTWWWQGPADTNGGTNWCLHDTLCSLLHWRYVFGTHNPWWQHSSRSLCPFSCILPMPWWPKQAGQASLSAPTLVLKSPSMYRSPMLCILDIASSRTL